MFILLRLSNLFFMSNGLWCYVIGQDFLFASRENLSDPPHTRLNLVGVRAVARGVVASETP